MDARKPGDRRHRTKRARQSRRDLFQKQKNRPHAVIEVLASTRAARERARMATQETAFASPSKKLSHPYGFQLCCTCTTLRICHYGSDDWMTRPMEASSNRHSMITLFHSGYALVPQLPQCPSIASRPPGPSDSIPQGLNNRATSRSRRTQHVNDDALDNHSDYTANIADQLPPLLANEALAQAVSQVQIPMDGWTPLHIFKLFVLLVEPPIARRL